MTTTADIFAEELGHDGSDFSNWLTDFHFSLCDTAVNCDISQERTIYEFNDGSGIVEMPGCWCTLDEYKAQQGA